MVEFLHARRGGTTAGGQKRTDANMMHPGKATSHKIMAHGAHNKAEGRIDGLDLHLFWKQVIEMGYQIEITVRRNVKSAESTKSDGRRLGLQQVCLTKGDGIY